jgi:hypothetical protein
MKMRCCNHDWSRPRNGSNHGSHGLGVNVVGIVGVLAALANRFVRLHCKNLGALDFIHYQLLFVYAIQVL